MAEPQLQVGVIVGLNSIHTIIVREEANGALRLMGEHRNRQIVRQPDETILVSRVYQSIEEAIKDAMVKPHDILTIGIASPGQIDIEQGTILFSPLFNLSDYPFPFVDRLQKSFDQHITLINNDDAHGIGEQRIGRGKDVSDLVYLRIGYNIGASIIINGKLYAGADNLAGEFGHMVVDRAGPECACGNKGCLNTLVSRAAMQGDLLKRFREGEPTVLAERLEKNPLDINAARIYDAIDQEDELALDVVDKAVESAKKRALYNNTRHLSIVRGMLGTTAGAYGAAVFAKQCFDKLNN